MLVLFARNVSRRFLDASLGFAAGVMLAASFWSLLAPSIDHAVAQGYGDAKWIPPLVGFLLGAACLRGVDLVLPHMHPDLKTVEGLKTPWQRSTLLVLAITIHNIPEGLAASPSTTSRRVWPWAWRSAQPPWVRVTSAVPSHSLSALACRTSRKAWRCLCRSGERA
jgi:zinc transporter ZupT